MRVFFYSASVTVLSAIGAFVISTIIQVVSDPTVAALDVAVNVLALSGWGVAIFAPAAIFFCLAVALCTGALRRRVWWVGALAGFFPSLALILFFNQPNADSSYQGTAEQLALQNATMLTSSLAFILWCSAAGAFLLPLRAFSRTEHQSKEAAAS